ncbi:MAG TPA: NAD(P)H-dependent oxidoreductase [Opitutus sp.]|nr:NAD(P)H-dependent oxidoreductase [Opitutus sp.]
MNPISPAALVHALRWRYATKKFDPTRSIPAETWAALEESLVLTPSSIGLQPWKFFVVTDATVKSQLRTAAYHQTQVSDCSHFLVFAVRKDLGRDHVERHIGRMVEVLEVPRESLVKFGGMAMRNLDAARAEGRLDVWQTHQIYIALGGFITAAAMVGVDTCPMEGLDPAQFDEILDLKGGDYTTVIACAAGYRHPEDKYAQKKKVRFKPEDVIIRL